VIITDGEDNASGREYSKAHVKSLISEQNAKYSWEFVYIGANQDAIQEGSSYGIAAGSSMSFGANEIGAKELYRGVTRSLNAYKVADVGVSYASATGGGFTDFERQAAMGVPDDFLNRGPVLNPITGKFESPKSENTNVKDDDYEIVI
jgi:hypothetical protein